MAAINSWWISCIVLVHSAYLGSCDSDSDYGTADGSKPELFIFHQLCALKMDEGPCKALKQRFYFDIDTGHCKDFQFGGCKGNDNNFETMEECEKMCLVSADKSPCHLEEAPGPCRGLVSRYFFDSQKKECTHFYYGGCFGNANNFKSMKECQSRCQNPEIPALAPKVNAAPDVLIPSAEPKTEMSMPSFSDNDFTPPEFCLSPIDQGTACEGEEKKAERRFVYNPKTKRCQWMTYSGCGGNKNNFFHRRHCIKMCMKPGEFTFSESHVQPNYSQDADFTPPEFCLSPIDQGTACEGEEKKVERRFVYNPKTKRCQWMHYSGCGGNKNNFVHRRHCIKMCMKPGQVQLINIKKNTNILFQSV